MPKKIKLHDEERHESEIAVAAETFSGIVPQYLGREWQGWRGRLPVLADVVSASYSSFVVGIGSSPFTGDMSRTGIDVPTTATPSQNRRYLFRLATIDIPNGSAAVVLGVHTATTLRAVIAGTDSEANQCLQPFELMVREPFWTPRNGNISWHLRVQQIFENPMHLADPCLSAGHDTYMDGTQTALLHVRCPVTGAYIPPGSGIPPGVALGQLGTWYDNRDWTTYIPVYGPRRIGLWSSVHQFDNDLCAVTLPTDIGSISQEDRFLQSFPMTTTSIGAKYGRIAGGISVELWPEAGDLTEAIKSGRMFITSDRRSE